MTKSNFFKRTGLLIAFLSIGVFTSCVEDDGTPSVDDPIASFTSEVDGLMVVFTNNSTDASTYSWDFGDGNSSEEMSPTHTYESGDTYQVTLTATDETGTVSDDVTNAVTVSEPVADPASLLYGDGSKTWQLIADVSTGQFPYTVQPTDNSAFWWAFGANQELCVRECIMDDTWTFNSDGTFDFDNNGDFYSAGSGFAGDETCFDATDPANWVGADGQDLLGWDSGTHQYEYDADGESLTVTGGFIGLHDATPTGSVSEPAASITYEVININVNGAVDTLVVQVTYPNSDSPTGNAYWRSTLVSYENEADIIVIEECEGVAEDVPPTVAAATPTRDAANVLSIYSDAYTDPSGLNVNPDWGQATAVTGETIDSNNMLKLASFNYQGIDFGGAQDVSGMTHVHLDMYTTNAEAVNFFLISDGAETPSALTITPEQWVGYDIPLSDFSSVVDLAGVIQFKFDGGDGMRTIYLDNMYFYSE